MRVLGSTVKAWPLAQLELMPAGVVAPRVTLALQGVQSLLAFRQITQERAHFWQPGLTIINFQ